MITVGEPNPSPADDGVEPDLRAVFYAYLEPYERAILARTGADTLSAAWEKLVHTTNSNSSPNTDHV